MPQEGTPPAPKKIKLPSGWAGLSFEVQGTGSRAVITEVPKACFSSQRFEGSAGGQVDGVEAGDIIVAINGDTPLRLAERISTVGDPICSCKGHKPGTMDKFAATPCSSCDFMRRRTNLGISVALQMWLKAVKRDQQFHLSVWKKGTEPPEDIGSFTPVVEPCRSAGVVHIGANSSRKLPEGLDRPLDARLLETEQPPSKKQLAAAAQQAAAVAKRKLNEAVQARQAANGAAQVAASAAARQATDAFEQALRAAKDAAKPFKKAKHATDDERRLDGDGMAYTLSEFIAQYGGSVDSPPVEWTIERRLDGDGQAYALDDFIREYGGTRTHPPLQWQSAKKWNFAVNFADL